MPVLVRVPTGAVAAMLTLGISGLASSQTSAALDTPTAKPMTPQRTAWLKGRCSELVAYFDRYGVGRGENSDGPRNHTRIGAAIECERVNYRQGIDSMAALLKRKAFDVPKPGTPAIEPQDLEAPDITNPTQGLR
jgi:hypothetical protein